jgi:hypothetical protein
MTSYVADVTTYEANVESTSAAGLGNLTPASGDDLVLVVMTLGTAGLAAPTVQSSVTGQTVINDVGFTVIGGLGFGIWRVHLPSNVAQTIIATFAAETDIRAWLIRVNDVGEFDTGAAVALASGSSELIEPNPITPSAAGACVMVFASANHYAASQSGWSDDFTAFTSDIAGPTTLAAYLDQTTSQPLQPQNTVTTSISWICGIVSYISGTPTPVALEGASADASVATGILTTGIKAAAAASDVTTATGVLGEYLLAAAIDTTTATGALATAIKLAAAMADSDAAASVLTDWSSVTLVAPLYTGVGGILDPNAVWSNGAPTAGDTVYYDGTNMTIQTDGEIVATSNDFSALCQWDSGGAWSAMAVVVTPGFVSYLTDQTTALGALSTAIQFAASAQALTNAMGQLLGAGGAAAPDTVNIFGSSITTGESVTASGQCAVGDNFLLVFEGNAINDAGQYTPPTSITYNGVSLTMLSGSSAGIISGTNGLECSVWYLENPPQGALYELRVSYPAGGAAAVIAVPCNHVGSLGTPSTDASADSNDPQVTATGADSSGFYIAAAFNDDTAQVSSGAGQSDLDAVDSLNGASSFSVSLIGGGNPGSFTWNGSGTSSVPASVAVAVAVVSGLLGIASDVTTGAGSLKTGSQLAGVATDSSTASAQINTQILLAGAVQTVSAALGNLATAIEAAAAAVDDSVGSGTITGSDESLQAAASDSTFGSAILNTQIQLLAAVTMVTQSIAALATQIQAAANAIAVTGGAGNLSTGIEAAAAATAQTVGNAVLSTGINLAGAATAASVASASVLTAIQAAAAASDVTNAEGALATLVKLLAAAQASSSSAATLLTAIQMLGTAQDASAAAAALHTMPRTQIAGAVQDDSTLAGDLTTRLPIGSGAASDDSTGGGTLTSGIGLGGSASDETTGSADLFTSIDPDGNPSDDTNASGTLSYAGSTLYTADVLVQVTPQYIETEFSVAPVGRYSQPVGDRLRYAIDWTGWLSAYWMPGAAVAIGDVVRPWPSNGLQYRCVYPGVTGAQAPTWSPYPNAIVSDGAAQWRAVPIDDTSLTATLASAVWTASSSGILISNQNVSGLLASAVIDTTGATPYMTYAVTCEATASDGRHRVAKLNIDVGSGLTN